MVLTHIDLLRPVREWQPPYNIHTPDSLKANMIRETIESVASLLGINCDRIAAVNLKPGSEYNVEQGLIPTVLQHLEDAKRSRYLRCLQNYQKEDYWRRLWRQSKNAGRFIARKGFELF